LYFLHRLLDDPEIKWMVGLSVSFFLTYTTNAYFGFFLALALAILVAFALVLHPERMVRRRLWMLAGSAGITLILCLPFLLFRSGLFALEPSLKLITDKSAALGSWLFSDSAIHSALISGLEKGTSGLGQLVANHKLFPPGRRVSPGFATIGLGIVGLVLAGRKLGEMSLDAEHRLLNRRELARAYGVLAVVGFILSFGPMIPISKEIRIWTPYSWLVNLPVFGQLRAPRRYSMLTVIALAVGCSYAVKRLLLTPRIRQGAKVAYSILVSIVIVVGFIPKDIDLEPSPLPPVGPEYLWLAEQPAGTAVFHYPPNAATISRVLQYQSVHHMPMLTGAGSYFPSDWYAKLDDPRVSYSRMLMNSENLESILDHGGEYVMVHLDLMPDYLKRSLRRQQAAYSVDALYGLELVQSFPGAEVYRIEPRGLVPPEPPEQAAAIATITDPDGNVPCGVFDVEGHGYKEIVFGNFPTCLEDGNSIRGEVAIQCLNGEGEWVSGSITNVQINDRHTAMSFDSQQDGTCGLFLLPPDPGP
jgi:hypothetical protein